MCPACTEAGQTLHVGDETCKPCSPDSYSLQSTVAKNGKYNSCPPTVSSPAGSASVLACECVAGFVGAGTREASADGSACLPCPRGTYKHSNLTGSSPCLVYPANSGTVEAGSVSCLCVEGYSGASGSSVCAACGPGTFKDLWSSIPCDACPPGTFDSVSAQTTCSACPSNRTSPAASTNITNCTCSKGFEPDELSVFEDIGLKYRACGPGTFKTVSGDVMCEACVADTYSTSPAVFSNASCTACLECVACVSGTFKDVSGSAACSQCSVGKYTPHASAILCLQCPLGLSSGEGGVGRGADRSTWDFSLAAQCH